MFEASVSVHSGSLYKYICRVKYVIICLDCDPSAQTMIILNLDRDISSKTMIDLGSDRHLAKALSTFKKLW